jgi:hypothetical protein
MIDQASPYLQPLTLSTADAGYFCDANVKALQGQIPISVFTVVDECTIKHRRVTVLHAQDAQNANVLSS